MLKNSRIYTERNDNMRTININSNIRLYYIPMTKLKTTTVGVYIHRPLNTEEASMNALLPYVLKRGCKKCRNLMEISKYLENLYGATFGTSVLKCGDDQILYFDAETISDKFAPKSELLLSELTALIFSVIFEPVTENGAFLADVVEQEKKNAVDRIEALMNDKRSYAALRCSEEMCRGENFAVSRLGNSQDIQKITPKALYDYYERIITSSVIDVYICGDAEINNIEETIKNCTSKLKFEPAEISRTNILKNDAAPKNVTEKMDVAQGKLSIGFRTNTAPTDADYPALMIFNSIFGAGAHSKLFNNVREKLSLAYYASSQLEKYKGLLIVNAGIEFKNFEKAHNESLAQLEEIKNGNISELEFSSSVSSVLNALESYYDDQRQMQNFFMREKVAGSDKDIELLKKQIQGVTVEDVVKVSRKLELDTIYFLTGKEEN